MCKLIEGNDWTIDTISTAWDKIDEIAQTYGWKGYLPQFEIVTYDQMIEVMSKHGLPVHYAHWSFGKQYVKDLHSYKNNLSNLPYELITNTNPAITHLMENNSACMQLTVLAHAAVGHNHFFKHNYLFKQWTSASTIVDYMIYAKNFIAKCERKYGAEEVEAWLDACHSIGHFSVNKYLGSTKTVKERQDQIIERIENLENSADSITDSILNDPKNDRNHTIKQNIKLLDALEGAGNQDEVKTNNENMLQVISRHSTTMTKWQKEICEIVQKTNQYFYPQIKTKIINEGFATFTHYTLMNHLYDAGMIDEGAMIEFLKDHTSVIRQIDYKQAKEPISYTLNPYKIGFEIFRDVRRMCESPTDEDRAFFPDIVDKNWMEVVNDIVENYNDQTFILQFLSPKLIRDLRLFIEHIEEEVNYVGRSGDTQNTVHYTILNTHIDSEFRKFKEHLVYKCLPSAFSPNFESEVSTNADGDRMLIIRQVDSMLLERNSIEETLKYIETLWGSKHIILILSNGKKFKIDTMGIVYAIIGGVKNYEQI